MLNSLKATNLGLRPLLAILLPLALWAALWLSLASGPGDIQGIIKPRNPLGFFDGLRAIFPIAAAAVAILIILAGVSQLRLRRFLFVSPLGLAALYGLAGLASSLLSPSRLVALYWAAAYLSVPLVLWAIVRGADTTGRLRRLINFNWLLATLLLGASALLAVASGYVHLGSLISDPSALLECRLSTSWFNASGGVLRQTGVGRYAAVVGLIALVGLWRGSWRPVWSLVLVGSLAMLLATGARTAFFGFAAAAVFVVLLYGGKRALVAGAAALIVLVPLAWGAGVLQPFLNSCILRGPVDSSAKPQPPVQLARLSPQEQPAADSPARVSLQEQPAADSPARVSLQEQPAAGSPARVSPQEQPAAGSPARVSPQEQPAADSPARVSPQEQPAAGSPARVSPQEQPAADSPASEGIPKGFFTLTGRTVVWAEGWKLFTRSPLLGFGFHADRLVLGQHMHNSFIHALVQTGLIGAIPFLAAILLGWVLLLKALRNLARLPVFDKHLVIQTGGILAFLTIRSLLESTGAFFGVDWLLLAPLLLYLQVVNRSEVMGDQVCLNHIAPADAAVVE